MDKCIELCRPQTQQIFTEFPSPYIDILSIKLLYLFVFIICYFVSALISLRTHQIRHLNCECGRERALYNDNIYSNFQNNRFQQRHQQQQLH